MVTREQLQKDKGYGVSIDWLYKKSRTAEEVKARISTIKPTDGWDSYKVSSIKAFDQGQVEALEDMLPEYS